MCYCTTETELHGAMLQHTDTDTPVPRPKTLPFKITLFFQNVGTESFSQFKTRPNKSPKKKACKCARVVRACKKKSEPPRRVVEKNWWLVFFEESLTWPCS